jgi:aryl-phospho-beta-D-glucosidase BglC (GH1 family)
MYDQFNTPAENDFIRITREKGGDQYALDTMANHWGGYVPDAALDAMAAIGTTHFRVPVGYWIAEPPVGGKSNRELGFQHEGFVTGGILYLEDLLAKLKQRNMSALIDVHAMPGGASNCQSYAGIQTPDPGFWTGSLSGSGQTKMSACGGAGPYTSTRPGSSSWMEVGVGAVTTLATWITNLEKNASLAGVVTGFEVVNEPGLGFNLQQVAIKKYHSEVVPKVQTIFRNANVGVNVTVNFIGPNDGGMGKWVRQQIDLNLFDGRSLVVDSHEYLNWDGQMSFSQARQRTCATTAANCGWSQYLDAGLSTLVGEWADAIDLNSPATTNIDDAKVRADLSSLHADQVSVWESTPGTVGHFYWTLRQGSGWDPRPNATKDPKFNGGHQMEGTAWDKSLKSFGTRNWNLGELIREGIAKRPAVTGICECTGCAKN